MIYGIGVRAIFSRAENHNQAQMKAIAYTNIACISSENNLTFESYMNRTLNLLFRSHYKKNMLKEITDSAITTTETILQYCETRKNKAHQENAD